MQTAKTQARHQDLRLLVDAQQLNGSAVLVHVRKSVSSIRTELKSSVFSIIGETLCKDKIFLLWKHGLSSREKIVVIRRILVR